MHCTACNAELCLLSERMDFFLIYVLLLTPQWVFVANFKLPEVGETFDSVEFIELEKEEAQELVTKYNKEGEQNLPPDYWQNRYNRDHHRGGGYSSGGQGRYGRFSDV